MVASAVDEIPSALSDVGHSCQNTIFAMSAGSRRSAATFAMIGVMAREDAMTVPRSYSVADVRWIVDLYRNHGENVTADQIAGMDGHAGRGFEVVRKHDR